MIKSHTKNKRIIWVADFETTYDTGEVNLWETKNTETKERFYGVNILSFFEWADKLDENVIIYFHNGAGFDNHFILNYMVRNIEKYRIYPKDHSHQLKEYKKQLRNLEKPNIVKELELNTLIEAYSKKSWDYEEITNQNHKILALNITLPQMNKRNTKHKSLVINDSYLLIQSSIRQWGKNVGLPKLDYEYLNCTIYSNLEEVPKEDLEYLDRDIDILERALEEFSKVVDIKYWGITAAQTAYSDWTTWLYKQGIKNKEVRIKEVLPRGKIIYNIKRNKYISNILPTTWLNEKIINDKDEDITYYDLLKPYYRGGISFCNPKYKGIPLSKVRVYDINSSYPAVMWDKQLPYGLPYIGDGGEEYPFKLYKIYYKNLYVKNFPFIPDKNGYAASKYYSSMEGEGVIYLATPEYDIFIKNYIWDEIAVEIQFSFKTRNDLFKEWVDRYQLIKQEGKKEGNEAKKQSSKIPQNSLYGKFGTKLIRVSRQVKLDDNGFPMYDEKEGILFDKVVDEIGPKYYFPLGIAITSYARANLINFANINYDKFIYCDTDSTHFLTDITSPLIDELKLGYWDCENVWDKAMYRHSKQYIHVNKGYEKFNVDISNIPDFERDEFLELMGKYFEVKVAGSLHYEKRTPKYLDIERMVNGVVVDKGCFNMIRGQFGKKPHYTDFKLKPVWEMTDKETPYHNEEEYKKYKKYLQIK